MYIKPILIIALAILLICSIVYIIYIKLLEKKYTRERFAFASLTASTTILTYAMVQVTTGEVLAERIVYVIASFFGLHAAEPELATISSKLLVAALAAFGLTIIHLQNRSADGWRGQISVDDHARTQEHRARTWIADGIEEGARIVTRAPARPTRAATKQLALRAVLDTPTQNVVWHEHARELVISWASTIRFYPEMEGGWNSVGRFWRGRDLSNDIEVLLFCYTSFEDAERVALKHSLESLASKTARRILIATRTGTTADSYLCGDINATILPESYLLDHLVNFTDYVFEIKRRVESAKLPDSELLISQIYTESELIEPLRKQTNQIFKFESLLLDWAKEPAGTQLAILGEYGQGKSTGTLMFVYNYIKAGNVEKLGKMPILLELRGKSPANLEPAELLGAWAQQYQIHASALMKLLIAGRLPAALSRSL